MAFVEYAEPKTAQEMLERYKRIRNSLQPKPVIRKPKNPMDDAETFLLGECEAANIDIQTIRSLDRFGHIVDARKRMVVRVHENFPDLSMRELAHLFRRKSKKSIRRILQDDKLTKEYAAEGAQPRRPAVLDIANEILFDYDWTLDEILGTRRHKPLVYVRQAIHVAAAEARPDMSFPRMGKILNRDHTTLLHSLNAMDKAKAEGLAEKRTTELGREYWIRIED